MKRTSTVQACMLVALEEEAAKRRNRRAQSSTGLKSPDLHYVPRQIAAINDPCAPYFYLMTSIIAFSHY